eukprot:TRINITY_DN31490_c0_g1_i1.p2 TRINITY_DN31490_c0_g1~~TRINITY_DN31490_c0_g1_i1.p2  ORF type:complete len:279 (+),score=81.63 TRINITY_DN31490_c0_g1_i1:55-891(+)
MATWSVTLLYICFALHRPGAHALDADSLDVASLDACKKDPRSEECQKETVGLAAQKALAYKHAEAADQAKQRGELDTAKAQLEAALTFGDNVTYRSNLGALLLEQGKHRQAEEHLAAATSLNPGSAEAWNNQGNALTKLGKSSEAAAAYGKAIKLAPNSANTLYNFAGLRLGQRKFGEAMQALQGAVSAAPDMFEARRELGNLYNELHKAQEAGVHYRAALKMRPSGVDAGNIHNDWGTMLAEAGRMKEATEQFSKAVKLAPGLEDARSNLERARSEL